MAVAMNTATPTPYYDQTFLTEDEAQGLLAWTTSERFPWQREVFKIFGRSVLAPRHIAWFGDTGVNYRYTGLDHLACGWPPELVPIRERLARAFMQPFNFVILNRYEHGGHHMGWHRDDERAAEPVIASISLGAARRFRIDLKDGIETFTLGQGSLLLFDGRHRHTLTKTKKSVGTRVNFTFRQITPT